MIFDKAFFIKQHFKEEELEKYKKSAGRNLNTAKSEGIGKGTKYRA